MRETHGAALVADFKAQARAALGLVFRHAQRHVGPQAVIVAGEAAAHAHGHALRPEARANQPDVLQREAGRQAAA